MINYDAVSAPDPTPGAVAVLDRQAKELKHNGRAPGNSWRDTADELMWTYHDRIGHEDPYGLCVTCKRWMPVLLKRKDPLGV